jgi:hypothetical protein
LRHFPVWLISIAMMQRSNRRRGPRKLAPRWCIHLCSGILAALAISGCSSFNRAWESAGKTRSETGHPIDGRWQGTWLSDANGHTDELRCLITPLSNDVHTARFHARYKIGFCRFSFGYSVPLRVQPTNNAFRFDGESNLGWLAGGTYRYEGTATATNFTSTYRSKYDHGTFQMKRPPAGE